MKQHSEKEQQLYALLDELAGDCNSVRFAKTELSDHLAKTDEDPDKWMADHLVRMVQLFAIEGHSGFSAGWAIARLEKLLRQEPLGPLTGEDGEWSFSDYGGDIKAQNKRCGHVFMRKDGTAFDSRARVFREPNGCCFTSSDSRVDITFPYTPTVEYVDVPADRD